MRAANPASVAQQLLYHDRLNRRPPREIVHQACHWLTTVSRQPAAKLVERDSELRAAHRTITLAEPRKSRWAACELLSERVEVYQDHHMGTARWYHSSDARFDNSWIGTVDDHIDQAHRFAIAHRTPLPPRSTRQLFRLMD